MSEHSDLLIQLDAALRKGSPTQRASIVRAITEVFLSKEAALGGPHIALFDDILCALILHLECEAAAELSEQIAGSPKAPPRLVRRFAHDEIVEVAGPVLSRSSLLTDVELVPIALQKGQKHLEAIARRRSLSEPLTDVLVDRGSFEVARVVVGNDGARFSDAGFTKLVTKSSFDERLAILLAARSDLPPALFSNLIRKASDAVRNALSASSDPRLQANIEQALASAAEPESPPEPKRRRRDYRKAVQHLLDLKLSSDGLRESISEFAGRRMFEETVASLAAFTRLPINHVDSLFDEPPANLVILCRSVSLPWETMRRILSLYTAETGQDAEVSKARADYQKLTPTMAQRLVRFWNFKPDADAEGAGQRESLSLA